jgi:hypothetical protein
MVRCVIRFQECVFLAVIREGRGPTGESANKAVELAPEDSNAHAIRALALDWNANSDFHTTEEVQDFLAQAEQEALLAQRLDSKNPLAQAYYAEILVDEQKWNQAELIMNQVFELPDASQWMDVYRQCLCAGNIGRL